MKKESGIELGRVERERLRSFFPQKLLNLLVGVAKRNSTGLYVVGGTVRDLLMGLDCKDLDLTLVQGAHKFCRTLQRELGEGTLVPLGTETEEACRLVWQGLDIDVSSFRGNATTIAEDLALRDFTINSMAVDLAPLAHGEAVPLLDPTGGRQDLASKILCHCRGAFADDPLRLLRGYRFAATLGFDLAEQTRTAIAADAPDIITVAAERVWSELNRIIEVDDSTQVLLMMHEDGLLSHLLPELYDGVGVAQPDFHHLDVFSHNVETLKQLEQLLKRPGNAYPENSEQVTRYLRSSQSKRCLKWAALLHDVGKPATIGNQGDNGRVTFHNHDQVGRRLLEQIANRLRWSREQQEITGTLIAHHMHPFHLCNVKRQQVLSRKAALKLCKRAGDLLPGLFLLAMADSLASEGALKPKEMEQELVELYREVETIFTEHIQPALSGPPLLRGKDLIKHFQLVPGPIFRELLNEVEVLQVEGELASKNEALAWVEHYLKNK